MASMSVNNDVTLTIDEGTLLLVAEVLREERGLHSLPVAAAQQAIITAVKRLRPSTGVDDA